MYNNPYVYGYDPYGMQRTQPQTNVLQISGEDAARNYPIAPNSIVALWDVNKSVIYYKTSDATGATTMQILDYKIRDESAKKSSEMEAILQRLTAIENQIGGLKHESAVPTAAE